MAKIPVTITISQEAIDLLKLLKDKLDRSQAYLVEKGIRDMAKAEGVELPAPKKKGR